MIELSVILPTYNRPRHLKRCLRSLCRLRYPAKNFEIVVVDDGGTVDSGPIVRPFCESHNVTLVRQENGGPASARNTASEVARGTFLAMIDDDCRPAPDWLARLAERLAVYPDRMVGGRVINRLVRNPYATASQTIVDVIYEHYNQRPEPNGFFTTNNLAVSAELFRGIGRFNAHLLKYTSEDRELCERWLAKGYHMEYVPEATVYHLHQLNARSFWRQHFGYGRGATNYHRLRAMRKSRPLRVDLELHSHLARRMLQRVDHQSLAFSASVSAALAASQAAYIAGFLYQHMEAWASGGTRHETQVEADPTNCGERESDIPAIP